MIRKITVREFCNMNDITIDDLKNFGDSRIGAEGLQEDTELTVYTDDDAWGGYSLIIVRNDNRWNDSVEVICGNIGDWNI